MHDPWGCGCVLLYEVAPGASWLDVTPTALRYVFQECDRVNARNNGGPLQTLRFCFASEHPVYDVAPHYLSQSGHPYSAWLARVPDLRRFLDHVKPALSARLAASLLPNHTGESALTSTATASRYRSNKGALSASFLTRPVTSGTATATFTPDAFTPLLFGRHSLAQIRAGDPDCWVASNGAQVVLSALFPAKHSHLGPLA